MLHEVNSVKFRKSDFMAAPDDYLEVNTDLADLDGAQFVNTPVLAVPECHVEGTLQFDGRSRVVSNLHYSGFMIVEDSITGEDLEYDFEADSEKEYSFDPLEDTDDQEDILVVNNNTIDLNDEMIEAIVYEAPMSITRLAREDYPSGKGWSLTSDQDEGDSQQQEDPRWAKLKDLNFEDN